MSPMTERALRTTGTTSRRTTGLLVAAAFALILAGVILFVAVGTRSGGGTALPGTVVDIGKAPAPSGQNSDPNQIQESGAARLQFVDKTDPNRVASELAYDKLDPVGPGYYTLTQPRAWVYMHDGRIMHIRADNGRVKMPSRTQQPESGEFRGNVVVRIFPPAAKGAAAKPIDPENDAPTIIGATDSVSFDSVLLELQTQDTVTVSSNNVLFQGDGLLVRANQVKERIELLKTRGRFVRFNPKIKNDHPAETSPTLAANTKPEEKSDKPTQPIAAGPIAASPNLPAAPTPTQKVQLYKALFSDNVAVSQTTRTLTADTLEVFARLIDNQFPANAFGDRTAKPGESAPPTPENQTAAATPGAKPGSAAPTTTSTAAASGASITAPAATAAPTATTTAAAAILAPGIPSLFTSAGGDDIVMNWTGTMILTPITEQAPPVELANGNHFAARFSANKPGGHLLVGMTDSANGAHGECSQVEYAATTQTLSLLSGPAVPKVTFDAPDTGLISVISSKLNLRTGVASIPGGGRLVSTRSGKMTLTADAGAKSNGTNPASPALEVPDRSIPMAADSLREITWTDQADFQFRVMGGKIQNAMDWAQFGGTVLARDRSSSVSGDALHVDFARVGKQATALKHLRVDGNAMAIGGPRNIDPNRLQPSMDPYIACDKLEIDFNPSKVDPDEVDPSFAVAVGSVKAANQDAALRANRLEASIARDAHNSIVVTDLVGHGDVLFDRTDGVNAKADELRASPVLRTARLTGQNVSIGRGASVIAGKQIDLDDAAGTMFVYGAGTFDHTQSESPQLADASGSTPHIPDSTHINAVWTKSMLFDNTRGTIDCDGDTVVVSSSALQTQTLRSQRLRLELSPASESDPKAAQPGQGGDINLGDNRRLQKATAIGASEEKEGAPHATVETRRYSPAANPGEERVLDQVFYVEAPRIIADDTRGTVSTPSAGRAIVRDQRAANTQAALSNSAGLPVGSGGPKGTSRFTWAESMEFTRATGVLTMKKDVELIHLPIGSQQVTRLVAMQLDAKFNVQDGAAGTARSAELVRADASGAVYAESGQQRLLCDTFGYDALRGTAEAGALPGNRVTLYDDRKGGQLVARKLFWDLVKDRVEIMEPAPITTPR